LTKIQRNEEGEERQPHGSDLRESGRLLHDTDTLLMLWKKTPMADEVQLIIEKQRDGETGFIRMTFDSQHLRFSE
jgi:replicative DNA helicase